MDARRRRCRSSATAPAGAVASRPAGPARRPSTPAVLLECADGVTEYFDQSIDLGLFRNEWRGKLNGVAAEAHVETILPTMHRDLERTSTRLARLRLEAETGSQSAVADIGDVFQPPEAVDAILEVGRELLHTRERLLLFEQ